MVAAHPRAPATTTRRVGRYATMAAQAIENRQACSDVGMNDYLAKPVRLQELNAALVKAASASH
jgi:CheY-like chemotaxis protein